MNLPEIQSSAKKLTEKTTVADKALLIALIFISVFSFVFIKKAFPQGNSVSIEVNGSPAYRLPLDKDAIVAVRGAGGDSVVEIKDKEVRFKDSPCPNKICVHNGWIDNGAIVCLPNKVTVTIVNPENNTGKTLDAIAG